MVEVISATGTPVYVCIQRDADFEYYGYYYEVFADEWGEKLLDWGNTYDNGESEESALEWACGVVETIDYHI